MINFKSMATAPGRSWTLAVNMRGLREINIRRVSLSYIIAIICSGDFMNKYIKKWEQKVKSFLPRRQAGQTNEEYKRLWKERGLQMVLAAMMAAAVISSITAVARNTITVSNSVNGRELPIYSVETDQKKVALTFDAAWGNEDTREILDILKRHNVKVTFFMTGGWVEAYPDDVKAILAAGHDLGNHSENHKNMSLLSDEECRAELMKVHDKVKELTGYEMYLFRPPYGDYDNHVIKNASQCGYLTVQWDVDTLVTKIKTNDYLYSKANVRETASGSYLAFIISDSAVFSIMPWHISDFGCLACPGLSF